MADTPSTGASRVDAPTGTSFVGHEWDGIEELNTPLPRWWLLTFWATVIWAAVYVVLYPAWPLVHSATRGVLGWSSRGQFASEMQKEASQRAPMLSAIGRTPVEQLPGNERLMQAAVEGGRAAFKVNCVQCHGSGANGSPGYPSLVDDDWLWGGDIGAIQYTITHGVRAPDDKETRFSQMPAFAGVLKPAEIDRLVAYVRTISKQQPANAASTQGAALFAANCASCHGADGKGSRVQGAPNLTDRIWLYGGDADTIQTTIEKSRYGVMPAWGARLDPVTIKMLAAYVYSLGGGEATARLEPALTDGAAPPPAQPAATKPVVN